MKKHKKILDDQYKNQLKRQKNFKIKKPEIAILKALRMDESDKEQESDQDNYEEEEDLDNIDITKPVNREKERE